MRIDVLGRQVENNGKSLSKTDLQGVLEKYFKEVPDLTSSDMTNEAIKNKELKTKSEYGDYTILIGEIYNGSFEEVATDLKKLQNYFVGQTGSSVFIFNEGYKHREGENMPDETKIHDYSGTSEYMIIEYEGKYYKVYYEKEVVDESLPETDSGRYDVRFTDVKESSYEIIQSIVDSSRFFLCNSQLETISIISTYLPKMIVEGEEIDLTSAIDDYGRINLYHNSIYELIIPKYSGKNVIITLTIDNKEVKWEGILNIPERPTFG